MPSTALDTISGLNDYVEVDTSDSALALFTVQTSSDWNGTLELKGTHTLDFSQPHYGDMTFSRLDGSGSTTQHVQANTTVTFVSPCGGLQKVRLTATAWSAGTATVKFTTHVVPHAFVLNNPLPTGVAPIGSIFGPINADDPAAYPPVPVGGMAETPADTAPVTRVSDDGDRTNLATTRDGQLYATLGFPQGSSVTGEYATAQTNTVLVAAPDAGLSIYLLQVIGTAKDAVDFRLKDEDDNLMFPVMYASGANWMGGATLCRRKLPAGKALEIDTSAAVDHCIHVEYGIGP